MEKLVAQHGEIGYLIAEIPNGESVISVIHNGRRVIAIEGKTWDATHENLLQNLHNDLWGVISKYATLGASADDVDGAVKTVLEQVGLL